MQLQYTVLCNTKTWLDKEESQESHSDSPFYAIQEPTISFDAYVARICTYAKPSFEHAVLASEIMRKLCETQSFGERSVHRLCIACVTLATKWLEDGYDALHKDAQMAKVGGISLSELSTLQYAALALLDWNLCAIAGALDNELTALYEYQIC